MIRMLLMGASILLALGGPAPLAWAVDYLVIDNDGATGGDGSVGNEFGTISEALANAPLAAGDRIVLAAGAYTNAHETFPLSLPDGVSLIGAGAGTTSIDATGAGTAAITLLGSGGAQTVSGIALTPDASDIGIGCTGQTQSVLIRNCAFSGGRTQLAASMSSGGLTVSSCTFAAWGDKAVVASWIPVPVSIRNNAFSGTVASATGVSISHFIPSSSFALNLNISSNTFSGSFADALYLRGAASGTGVLTGTIAVRNNIVSGASSNGIVVIAGVTGGTATLVVDIECNEVTSCGLGLLMIDGASSSGALDIDKAVASNILSSNSMGLMQRLSANNFGVAVVDIEFLRNCIGGNSSDGMSVFLDVHSSGTLDHDLLFDGNLVASNGLNGLRFGSSISGTVTLSGTPDLGGGAFLKGLNTFAGNNTQSSASAFNINLEIASASATWLGQGNWLGASTAAGVNALLNDRLDNSAYPLLDVSGFLSTSFDLIPVGPTTTGQPITIATADGAFLAEAGKKVLTATLGGAPLAVNVAPDGCTIDFVVPFGLLPGNTLLVVTNPGGQIGTAMLFIIVDEGGGGCFVATAAYGDEQSTEVRTLRAWRDRHLASNPLGRWLVSTYYWVSPAMAEAIADRPWARTVSRAALTPMVGAARLWMNAPWAFSALVVGAGWMITRRRRA